MTDSDGKHLITEDNAKESGSRGGKARASNTTPEQRSAIAKKGADARWGRTVVTATHQGPLDVGGYDLDCAVLEDGRRVISQASIMEVLGRSTSTGRRTRNDNRPPFIEANNLQPYITDQMREHLTRIDYRVGGQPGIKNGYDATLLPLVCEAYLAAREDKSLNTIQMQTAQAAEILVRSLAKVGIIALVDEATGYQETRAKDELAKLLAAYVNEEFQPWIKRFPQVFFKEIYTLYGWDFIPGNHQHPGYVGKFINKYVYDVMPPGILERLRELNPRNEEGNRSRKHHQHLTEDTGLDHLDNQIRQTITLMQASDTPGQFDQLFRKVHPELPYQPELPEL